MNHITEAVSKHFPQLNKRRHVERDAYEFCERNGIIVHETLLINDLGEYRMHKGVPFILLNKFITDRYRTWVLFHEIAHYILHPTEISNFSDEVTKRKAEKQANFVAALLMMPKPFIRKKTLAEIQDELGCARKIILYRKDICDNQRM